MKDFSITVYSGTSLENFNNFTVLRGEKGLYRKNTDTNFFSQRIFFSKKPEEALFWALCRAIEHRSEPLVMSGKLPWFHRFNVLGILPKGAHFPVDEVRILGPNLTPSTINLFDPQALSKVSRELVRVNPGELLRP